MADKRSHTTHLSLIDRLQDGEGKSGWTRFLQTYEPLIFQWLRFQRVSIEDSEDIAQEVLIRINQKIPEFEHDGRPGVFRGWMHRITINVMRNFRRARATRTARDQDSFDRVLSQLQDPRSDLSREFHRQHNLYLLKRLLDDLKQSFSEQNLEMFYRYGVDEEDVESIAEEFGVAKNAVYVAKFRILRALKSRVGDVEDFLNADSIEFEET